MWTTRIGIDRKNPEVVTVSAIDTATDFTYSETLIVDKFDINSFVEKAINELERMNAGRTKIFIIADKLAQDIFNALNKGVESVVSVEKNAVQCSEKVVEEMEKI